LQCGRAVPADQNRWVWVLHRLGPGVTRFDVDELAVELGLVLRPQRTHRSQLLVEQPPTGPRVRAMVTHLFTVPADPDAEQHTPTRERSEERRVGKECRSRGGREQ